MKSIRFKFNLEVPCEIEIAVPEASYGDPVAYAEMILRFKSVDDLLKLINVDDRYEEHAVNDVEFADEGEQFEHERWMEEGDEFGLEDDVTIWHENESDYDMRMNVDDEDEGMNFQVMGDTDDENFPKRYESLREAQDEATKLASKNGLRYGVDVHEGGSRWTVWNTDGTYLDKSFDPDADWSRNEEHDLLGSQDVDSDPHGDDWREW